MATVRAEGWLGEPIAISAGQSKRVEAIRVAALGGAPNEPLKHRGEAETCFVIKEIVGGTQSVWITDDEAAYDFGKQLGILTWDTRTTLEHLIADGVLTATGAFDLLLEMLDADRYPRRLPTRPGDLT
jgi:hypothetical protein